jgi:hypothetical protein
MAHPDDKPLLEEIRAVGQRAEAATPEQMDLLAAATKLAQRFDHRTVDDIREQLKLEFRRRGLFWADGD